MSPASSLGVRLAVGNRHQRMRSVTVMVACALGTAFLLSAWGIAVDQLLGNTAFRQAVIIYLIAGTVLVVALPVLALLSTVGRMSASIRDRRLANLRLLGMTAGQTRVVAATEVGLVSVVGTVLGAVLHVLVAAAVPAAALAPWPAWLSVLVAVPLSVLLIAMLPQRASARAALEDSRRSVPKPPAWWRLAPLVVGLALCGWTQYRLGLAHSEVSDNWVLAALFGGVALVGIGVLTVVPVFTRFVAELLLRVGRGPRATLLGRRLQDQPASMTRVISTLMVGLFVVMMTRAVLSAFFSTPQYIAAADHVERDQTTEISVPRAQANATRAELKDVATIDRVVEFPVLLAVWGDYEKDGSGATVIVARCADLADPPLAHCSDARVNAVGDLWWSDGAPPRHVELQAFRAPDWTPVGPKVRVAVDFDRPLDPTAFQRAVGALDSTSAGVVSPDLPGVADLQASSSVLFVAHAGPGEDLYPALDSAGIRYDTAVDVENYHFVQGMQTLVWTIAVAVLTLGLLAFTVAGIDRAVARRRELTALRLIGTPPALLRWTQWLEAVIPTVLGSLLALSVGAYAGRTYLAADDRIDFPVVPAVLLSVAAVVVSAALAAITVLGTSARLDPEHIRTE